MYVKMSRSMIGSFPSSFLILSLDKLQSTNGESNNKPAGFGSPASRTAMAAETARPTQADSTLKKMLLGL